MMRVYHATVHWTVPQPYSASSNVILLNGNFDPYDYEPLSFQWFIQNFKYLLMQT